MPHPHLVLSTEVHSSYFYSAYPPLPGSSLEALISVSHQGLTESPRWTLFQSGSTFSLLIWLLSMAHHPKQDHVCPAFS